MKTSPSSSPVPPPAPSSQFASRKKYTGAEICAILGCSGETLRDWRRKESLPSGKRGKFVTFKLQEVYDFLVASGRDEYASRIEKLNPSSPSAAPEPAPTPAAAPAAPSVPPAADSAATQPPPEPTLESFIRANSFDLYGQRAVLCKIFEQRSIIMSLEKNPVNANRLAALLTQVAEILRKQELACIDIDERLKKVVLLGAVKSAVGKLFTTIKTELRSVPGALSERLAAESEPKAVHKILKDAVDSVLRHLSDDFLKEKPQ